MPFEWREPTRHKFLKLEKPADLNITYECAVCLVALDYDDGLYCPSCGTQWDSYAGDGDEGYIEPGNWDEDQFEETITDRDEAYERGDEAIRKLKWSKGGLSASC